MGFRASLRPFVVVLVVALVPYALAPRPVLSAPSQAEAKARALFRQAEIHFSLGEFDEALAHYSEAYKLRPLPGFLFNIAQCHRLAGRFAEAAFSFRVYLQKAPEAANRAEVEALVAQLEGQKTAPAPAPSEAVPPPRESPPPRERAPEPSSAPVAPPPSEAQAVALPEAVAPGAAAGAKVKPWVWAASGAGLGLLLTGLVTGQMADACSEAYRDPATSVARRRDLRDSGRTLAATSVVSLSLGAVALLAAGWGYFGGRHAAGPAPVEVDVGLGDAGALVGLRGAF